MEAAVNSKVLHSRTSRSLYHTRKNPELIVDSTIFLRDIFREINQIDLIWGGGGEPQQYG